MSMPKYVSVDIETTGLDPDIHSIIEFGAVAWCDDGPIMAQPTYETLIRPATFPEWSTHAADMHRKRFGGLEIPSDIVLDRSLNGFREFLVNLGITHENQVHVVGQNFASFDLQFLNRCNNWPADLISYRYFDVGSAYAGPLGMISLADLPVEDKELAGVTHCALDDAKVALYHARNFLQGRQGCCNREQAAP